MLTPNTSSWILDNLKPDFVLNGHDHCGCDVVHIRSWNEQTGQHSWSARSTSELSPGILSKTRDREQTSQQEPVFIREVTQRSMMAEFGGYAGLFEARVSEINTDDVEFHYIACGFYTDLSVWTMIVTDIVIITIWALVALYRIQASIRRRHQSVEKKFKKL